MIEVIKVENKEQERDFVMFPFKLYKGCDYWVPPIISEELESMDKEKNPVFKNAEAEFYVAKKDGVTVGRIAAIVNWVEIEEQKKNKLRFGWYDTIDDLEVSKKLLESVVEFGKSRKLEFVDGPVGFSNMDKAGLLIEGYEELNTMITWYHYPYQKEHLKKLGFRNVFHLDGGILKYLEDTEKKDDFYQKPSCVRLQLILYSFQHQYFCI